ncbi:MAG: NADP-dependent oxidoreductase [Burkholderiales bacterium]|nr:NADP-dependent oxidoreductase [Burkholderiales bacterium]
MTAQDMRAWRIHRYGGAEVLALDRVAVPVPGPGEILVRVAAASVNPIDWKMRAGHLRDVFPLAFPRVLGRDCAGAVIALGAGVTGIGHGQAVAGVADPANDGTHAECAILPAAQAAPLPAGLAPAAAVCLCVSGLSAYIPLVEDARVRPGQRVLVHGGAGGVGNVAVQIARHLGAEVLATCSAANRDHCLALGAARVIDYAAEDFVAVAGPCDVVLDTAGGAVHARSPRRAPAGRRSCRARCRPGAGRSRARGCHGDPLAYPADPGTARAAVRLGGSGRNPTPGGDHFSLRGSSSSLPRVGDRTCPGKADRRVRLIVVFFPNWLSLRRNSSSVHEGDC